jgi:hypothetical protein
VRATNRRPWVRSARTARRRARIAGFSWLHAGRGSLPPTRRTARDVPRPLYSFFFVQRSPSLRICSAQSEILDSLRGVASELDVERPRRSQQPPRKSEKSLKVGGEVAEDYTEGSPQPPSMVVVDPWPPTPLPGFVGARSTTVILMLSQVPTNANGTSKRRLAAGIGAEAEKSAEGQASISIFR